MNKKVVIGVSIGAVAIVGVGALILSHKSNPEQQPSSSEMAASSEVVSSTVASSIPEQERGFEKVVFDGPSMVGQAEYDQLTYFKNEQDAYREDLDLVKANTETGSMIYATGHQVYSSQSDEYRYILSGYSPIK